MPRLPATRRLVLPGAVAALAVLELWHPQYAADASVELLPDATRWLAVHLLQLPLIGLLTLLLLSLVRGISGPAATVSRVGTAVFAAGYLALDSIAGIATGVLARYALTLPAGEQAEVARAIDVLFTDPLVGGGFSLLTAVATGGWLVGVLGAAAALARGGAGRLPVLLLSVAAFLFALGHAPPFGPLGLACLCAAAITIEWKRRDAPGS